MRQKVKERGGKERMRKRIKTKMWGERKYKK